MTLRKTISAIFMLVLLLSIGTVSAQDEVTLTFWFEGENPASVELFGQILDRFEELNPGVTIDFTSYPFTDFLRVMPLALDGGEGPDVAYIPWGIQALGSYALAGHLVELTDIGAERGWFDNFDIEESFYTNDQTPEQVFGIPFEITTIGVFYNTEMFDELGVEIPETFEEFESALATIKDAGITPITVGSQDAWPLSHVWLQNAHTVVPIDNIAGIEQNDPDARLDTAEWLIATEKLVEWTEAGYLDPNMLSTNYSDSNNLFINGDAAMSMTGTWALSDFVSLPEFEAGFFPTPQMDPELPWHVGGKNPYNNLVVNATSEHQELALDLVDFLLSEEAQTMFWDAGLLVTYQFDEAPEPVNRLQSEVYEANTYTGIGYHLGITCSDLGVESWRLLQELVGGQISSEDFLAEHQRVYEEDCLDA